MFCILFLKFWFCFIFCSPFVPLHSLVSLARSIPCSHYIIFPSFRSFCLYLLVRLMCSVPPFRPPFVPFRRSAPFAFRSAVPSSRSQARRVLRILSRPPALWSDYGGIMMVAVMRLILGPYACCGIRRDYLFRARMLKTSVPQPELVF